jgi:hypothetical protein
VRHGLEAGALAAAWDRRLRHARVIRGGTGSVGQHAHVWGGTFTWSGKIMAVTTDLVNIVSSSTSGDGWDIWVELDSIQAVRIGGSK